MILDPSAPRVALMVVLCKDVSFSNFNEKHLNVHKYELLGGLHSFQAKSELLKENPDIHFFNKTLAEVYLELSDEQALQLAKVIMQTPTLYTGLHTENWYVCIID